MCLSDGRLFVQSRTNRLIDLLKAAFLLTEFSVHTCCWSDGVEEVIPLLRQHLLRLH